MDDYGLDLHGEMLLDAYRQRMPLYKQLQDLVMRIIREQVNQTDIRIIVSPVTIGDFCKVAMISETARGGNSLLSDWKDVFYLYPCNISLHG